MRNAHGIDVTVEVAAKIERVQLTGEQFDAQCLKRKQDKPKSRDYVTESSDGVGGYRTRAEIATVEPE